MPVAADTGLSSGYLRPAEGLVSFGTGQGVDRGGINWNGTCYRVMGSKLAAIAGAAGVTTIGDVGSGGPVSFDYSFDLLSIVSANKIHYYDGSSLTSPTDPDFGVVLDAIWVDGYFMITDGDTIAVTELNDPNAVNPLKYGSSEVDPDPIVGLLKLRNEVQAINRYTIESFQNVGGNNFPFQRIEGAQVQRGALGLKTAAVYLESIAFLGSGRNEAPSVWIGSNGSSVNIASREVDLVLKEYTETQLAASVLEVRVDNAQKLLYLHLPDQTLVYDGATSQVAQQPIWYTLTSSVTGLGQYRARNFVWCYDKWLCGDPTTTSHGYLSDSISSHYGAVIGWEFGTGIVYNEGNGAIFRELELVCLTGRTAVGTTPTVWTSYSVDGMSWSQETPRTLGTTGETVKRIIWYQQGFMRNWRCQKFRGTSDTLLSVAALTVKMEPLNA